MRDKRPVDELSIEELERILAIRKREARMDRLRRYENNGRRIVTEDDTSDADDAPVQVEPEPAATVLAVPAEEPVEAPTPEPTDEDDTPQFEDELDRRATRRKGSSAPSSINKKLVWNRLLLVVEIAAAVGRDTRERKRMTVMEGGRAAVTRYETVGCYRKHTLLACRPLTGRTHQIRVHLAHIGYPIVGDAVYGGRRPRSRGQPAVPCPRQFLHAHRIRFRLPATGEEVEFTSPLPPDLQAVLEALERET